MGSMQRVLVARVVGLEGQVNKGARLVVETQECCDKMHNMFKSVGPVEHSPTQFVFN